MRKTLKESIEMSPNTSPEFQRFIELQKEFLNGENAIAKIDAVVNTKVAAVIAEHTRDWAAATEAHKRIEREIISLAERHPEWKDGESIKSPFGTVSFRKTTSLEIHNEGASITLIRSVLARHPLRETAIRTEETINREVLESLTDLELASIGIARSKGVSISVKAKRVDMAKANKPKPITDAELSRN